MMLELDYDSQTSLLSAILFYRAYIERKSADLRRVGCFGASNKFIKEKELLDNISLDLVFER